MTRACFGFTAQVVASGPTARPSFVPEMFESVMFGARRELVIATPYYVPDAAFCGAANHGVAATIVFPARNDDVGQGDEPVLLQCPADS